MVASVSITTQGKDQAEPLQRTLDALAGLPVRGLATLGPHLSPEGLSVPANVVLEPYVPHAAVLPHASAMITHAGHSGVMTALAYGVPLVCVPGDRRAPNTMRGKDQPAIAMRVAASGAGLRLAPDATSSQIRAAVQRSFPNNRSALPPNGSERGSSPSAERTAPPTRSRRL